MKLSDARKYAMSLQGTTEAPHHHMRSFRVEGRIYATVPDDDHLHIFVDSERRDAALAMFPEAYEKLWWGKNVVGIKVKLASADDGDVKDLLHSAHAYKAG